MEMFRVNGMSSEDLIKPGQNPTKAFLGKMFKMGEPVVTPQQAASNVNIAKAQADAEASGNPATEAALEAPNSDEHRWTSQELGTLTKEKLVELASALGVADITQPKAKLIEAILNIQ